MIPRTVHFIFYGKTVSGKPAKPFCFFNMVSVVSSLVVGGMEEAIIWTDLAPVNNYWWDTIVKFPGVKVKLVNLPDDDRFWSLDLIRYETLLTYGGFYSDIDNVFTSAIPRTDITVFSIEFAADNSVGLRYHTDFFGFNKGCPKLAALIEKLKSADRNKWNWTSEHLLAADENAHVVLGSPRTPHGYIWEPSGISWLLTTQAELPAGSFIALCQQVNFEILQNYVPSLPKYKRTFDTLIWDILDRAKLLHVLATVCMIAKFDSASRLTNALAVIEHCAKLGYRVTAVEYDSDILAPLVYQHVRIAGQDFSRSIATNAGIATSNTPVFTVLDADCMVDAQSLYSAVKAIGTHAEVVVPYENWCCVSQAALRALKSDKLDFSTLHTSREYLAPSEAQLKEFNSGVVRMNMPSGGLTTYDTAFLRSVGCMNASFAGWGHEDSELVRRIILSGGKYAQVAGNCAHFEHDRPSLTSWYSTTDHFKSAYLRDMLIGTAKEILGSVGKPGPHYFSSVPIIAPKTG